jgi:hypothetical protein
MLGDRVISPTAQGRHFEIETSRSGQGEPRRRIMVIAAGRLGRTGALRRTGDEMPAIMVELPQAQRRLREGAERGQEPVQLP